MTKPLTRLRTYVDARSRRAGDAIHTLHAGTPDAVELLASDIRAMIRLHDDMKAFVRGQSKNALKMLEVDDRVGGE